MVTQADITSALEKQKQLGGHKQIGDLLVSMGLITEQDRVRVLGEHWGVPFINLAEAEISYEVVTLVSQDLARRYKLIAVALEGNRSSWR
jgi:uncharacterized protein with ACT and thioredoxin-like domain